MTTHSPRPPEAIHPALVDAFDAFDRAGVRWCLIRRPVGLAVPSGDIDVLVDRLRLRQTASLLRERGFALLPRFNEGHSFVRYDAERDAWLWLDITTALSFGRPPVPTGAEAQCLERRRRAADGLWVLDPGDTFWALILHAGVDGRPLASRHREQLRSVASDALHGAGILAELAGRLLPPDLRQPRLVEAVLEGDWRTVERGLDAMGAGSRRLRSRRPATSLAAAARRIARRVPKRGVRGMSVALIGPDGVGKSTLANALAGSFIVPTRLVYMGVWRTPAPFRLLGAPGRVGHAVMVQWARWAHGALHRLRGRLVIFDRYTEEHLAPPERSDRVGPLLQRIRSLAACPAPDLVLLLDAPGAVAYSRKGEHSPEELERIRDRYRRIVTRFPHILVLDAGESADLVRRRAVDAIWSGYRRRVGAR